MKKKLSIIGIILVIIAVVLMLAYRSNGPGISTSPNANTNPTTKATIFDENSLISRGVTSQQLSNLERVLGQYFSSQGKTPNQVDFNTIYRVPPDPNNPNPFSEITFVVQLDGQPAYKAKMDSFSTSEIRLYLYALDGSTLLYDSQNVGGSSN